MTAALALVLPLPASIVLSPAIVTALTRAASRDPDVAAEGASDLVVLARRDPALRPVLRAFQLLDVRAHEHAAHERPVDDDEPAPRRKRRRTTKPLSEGAVAFSLAWQALRRRERTALRKRLGASRQVVAGWCTGSIPNLRALVAIEEAMRIHATTWHCV